MDKIVFIKERMEMGITHPFICQTENDEWYIVKTLNMMPISQLLAEVIGSKLVAEIGLPCPPVKFIYIPLQATLYVRADRTASLIGTGNINLLFDEEQKKILVIDHNLAFDENADFSEHIFAPLNRTWRLDWVDKQTFTEKAIDILRNFDDIYKSIPDDWFARDEQFQEIETQINRIRSILNRITEDYYWDNIE